jgi:hypothetical protein
MVVAALRVTDDNGIDRSQLAPRFRSLSDDDLRVRSVLLLARKPLDPMVS